MIRLTLSLILILMIGCGQKTERLPDVVLNNLQIDSLLTNWKADSVGCLRRRDPDKMLIYAKELIGKDSFELVRQLGPPNAKYDGGGRRHFQYFLMCETDGPSYYNFNFHFSKDTLEWFSNPVH